MNLDEAFQFIQAQISQGVSEESISGELMHQGLNYRDITQLIAKAKQNSSGISQSQQVVGQNNQSVAGSSNTSSFSADPISVVGMPTRKKTGLFIAIAVVAFIVLGGGAYAYYYFSNPSPEAVLHKMMANISQVSSFSTAISGDFTVESSGGTNFSFGEATSSSVAATSSKAHVELSADTDITDVNNPQVSLTFNGNGGSGLMTVVLGGQIIYKDKTGYLKVSSGTSIGPISLNMLADQWIKIDPQKDITTSTIPGVGLDISGKQLEATADQISQVRNIIKNSYLFKDIKQLPNETIDGVSTYHYGFSVDLPALNKFSNDINLVFDPSYIATTTRTIPEGTNLEIWVGTGDDLPRKIAVSDPNNQLQITFSNYNNVPEIQVPQNAKSFQEIIGPLFDSIFGGSMSESKTATSSKPALKK